MPLTPSVTGGRLLFGTQAGKVCNPVHGCFQVSVWRLTLPGALELLSGHGSGHCTSDAQTVI